MKFRISTSFITGYSDSYRNFLSYVEPSSIECIILLSRISGLPPLRGTLCKSVNTRVANYSSADIKVTREDTIKKGTLNELKKKIFCL
jgi:hypothetical protein